MSNKIIIWILTFLLLSSIFRLSNLDLIEFKSDEATTISQIVKFFDSPYIISRGLISGTGVYSFPLFNYLMIPVSILSRDPQVLSGIIALINSLLVVLFFFFVKKFYGILTAIFASTLLAFSPWGVLFSRKIWAQDLILLLLIPIFWFVHEIILNKNNKVILPLFLLLVLLIQLHGSGLFFSSLTILILLIWGVKISPKVVLFGILIGLIPAIPYILFQISSTPFCPDCQAFLKYQQSFRLFDFYNLLRPFQIISGLGFHFILGKSYADFIAFYPQVELLKYVFATGILIILTGIFLIINKLKKYLFLVIYFVTIPCVYLITKTPAYMHYFVIIIPVAILLFTLPISFAYSSLPSKFLKWMILAFFLLFLASNITFLAFFYQFVGIKKNIEGDYGPIYSITK